MEIVFYRYMILLYIMQCKLYISIYTHTHKDVFIYIYIYIYTYIYAAAKSLQSGLTLCDLTDSSPPGFPIPGILQARIPEWVAISFSNAWKWKVKVESLSSVRFLATPWTAAYQAPPSIEFSRQEYWSRVPLPSPIYMYILIILLKLNILMYFFFNLA